MTREVESKFEFEGITLKVVESRDDCCACCFFNDFGLPCGNESTLNVTGDCSSSIRNDHKHVIFITD